jgi:surface protein
MFGFCFAFNQPLNDWDVSNVTDFSSLFYACTAFNQPLNNWNVSNATNFGGLFQSATNFNQPLNNWDVSNVTNMSDMFQYAYSFNQPLNNWNVSSVTNMEQMFYHAHLFDQPINNWNISNVTRIASMFHSAYTFNQPLDLWDVSNITSPTFPGLTQMFAYAVAFNQPLNTWDVSNITVMHNMFRGAISFNQPLDNWDVSNVENMQRMFEDASSFNQSLGNWNFTSCWNFTDMLSNSGMSPCNYDLTLQGWAASNTLNNWQTLGVNGLQYTTEGAIARQSIIDNHEWIITGDALVELTDLLIDANINGPEISIIPSGGTGSYIYSWTGPNGFESNLSSIVAPQNGLYTVTVTDGCETWSDTFEVLTVQITEVEATNIQIFPNPSSGLVQIVSPTAQQLALYDQSGRRILETNLTAGKQPLDLSALLPGVYSGRLMSLNGEYLQTVMVVLVR